MHSPKLSTIIGKRVVHYDIMHILPPKLLQLGVKDATIIITKSLLSPKLYTIEGERFTFYNADMLRPPKLSTFKGERFDYYGKQVPTSTKK